MEMREAAPGLYEGCVAGAGLPPMRRKAEILRFHLDDLYVHTMPHNENVETILGLIHDAREDLVAEIVLIEGDAGPILRAVRKQNLGYEM